MIRVTGVLCAFLVSGLNRYSTWPKSGARDHKHHAIIEAGRIA